MCRLRYTRQVDAVAALGGEFSGMKLTCEQCGTQYSVSDSKIVGADRVFKIRCKACDAIMNIPGLVSDSGENVTADATSDDPQWFYALDGQQVGPVSLQQFEEAVHSGTVAANTYVWRSGMADWKSAHEVPEIAERLQAKDDASAADGLESTTDAPPEEESAVANQEEPSPPAGVDTDEPAQQDDVESDEAPAQQDDVESDEAPTEQDELSRTIADDSGFTVEVTQAAAEEEAIAPVEDDTEFDASDTTIFTMAGTEDDSEPSPAESLETAGETSEAPPAEASDSTAEESEAPDDVDVPAVNEADQPSDPGPRRTSTIDAIGQPLEFEEASMASEESSDEATETDASRDSDDSGPEHTIEQPSPWADYNEEEEEPKVDTGATLDGLFMGSEVGETHNEDDGDMVWERHENSVLFSLGDLDEAPAPPSRRAKGGSPEPSAESDTTVESSLIDIGSFRKKKQSKNSRSDLFGALTQNEANTSTKTGDSTGFAMSPNSAVLPGVRRQKRAHFKIGVIAIAAAVLAGIVTAVAIWMFGDHDANTDSKTRARTASTAVETAAVTTKEPDGPSLTASTAPRGTETTAPSDKGLENAAETSDSNVKATAPTETATPEDKPSDAPGESTVAPASEASDDRPDASPAAVVAKADKPTTPPKPLTPKERREARKKAKERAEKKREKREKLKVEKAARTTAAEEQRMQIARKKAAAERKKVDKSKAPKTGSDLNKQLSNLRKKQTNSSTGLGGLPARLTSGQIRRVVRRAYGSVRGCARVAGLTGIRISVKFTINGSGSVGGVAVTGPAAGTSANGCVQGAIRRLRFPQFNGSQRVSFPFMIK